MLVIEGSSELTLVVIVTMGFRAVNGSDIDYNVCLVDNGRVASSDDASILILRKLLQHPACKGFVAVEGSWVGENKGI